MERQMPPDDAHRVGEGQGVGIAAGLAAGVVDQAAQGEMGQEQAIKLLLGEVRPPAAQHQPLPRQRHLQLGKAPSLCQRS